MDSAVGVPKEFKTQDLDDLTPMITQYVDICEEYDAELVLFHVGDFYKAFGEAAETVARLCELTLATREDNTGEYNMAGLRVENAETHLETLLDAGYRIAIAEQIEDPESVSGVADRAVTRIITPGTLTETELLAPTEHNYVLSLATTDSDTTGPAFGLAFLDVSTGAFYTTSLTTHHAVVDEINRIQPAEAILSPELMADPDQFDRLFAATDCVVTEFRPEAFDPHRARDKVASYFGALQGSTSSQPEVRASGALLSFAEYTRGSTGSQLEYIIQLTRYDPSEYMQIDDAAIRGLELFERRTDQSPRGATLIDVLDACVSALGSRQLRQWLRRPLLSLDQIEYRHDAVEDLVHNEFTRADLQDTLTHVYDIERLTSHLSRSRAGARELRQLYDTLATLPTVKTHLDTLDAPLLVDLQSDLPRLGDLRSEIDAAIKPDPASELTEGGIIKPGYNAQLDALRATVSENQEWIEHLEASERKRTGIENLRVGHTEVHGYYIEVTDSHLDDIPDDYHRRQTLKNKERFYTPELRDREEEILAARQRANDLEYELFCEVRNQVADHVDQLQVVADQIATLDALCSFAEVAGYNDYTRPSMAPAGSGISISGGRHPVVEQTQESFVPNDTRLDTEQSLLVITGPNMSGKSTYLRQVALITIIAQSGGFVPADTAEIGITDRVFTRIGASDDITGGRSTFMIEMSEVADILDAATENSLVLLDEVGRGTSTADGYALARAITAYLHDELGAWTLFATHHHALTEYIEEFEQALNLHFTAEQRDAGVVFHFNIKDGAAGASYGIDVAKEAGVPQQVIQTAARLVATDTSADQPLGRDPQSPGAPAGGALTVANQLMPDSGSLNANAAIEGYDIETVKAVIQALESIEVPETTPLEALQQLKQVQDQLRESEE